MSTTAQVPDGGGRRGRRVCRRCGDADVANSSPDRFCCAGCALATRVPRDENGDFPANGALAVALVLGLVGFNQLLLASLSYFVSEGKMQLVARLQMGSLISAGLFWAGLMIVQHRVGARTVADSIVMVLTAAILALAGFTGNLSCGVFANVAAVAWSLRGLLGNNSSTYNRLRI